jgi:uncharacterized membrane-anchored protein
MWNNELNTGLNDNNKINDKGTGKTKLLVLALVFQIVILSVMVFTNYAIVLWGEKITVKVEPVDPRSLFQGDYVRLGYPFNQLDLNTVRYDFDPTKITNDETIYLIFTPVNKTYEPSFVTQNPKKTAGQVYIKGKFLYMTYNPNTFDKTKDRGENSPPSILRAEWGIEQYFVPEGKGKEIENQIRDGVVYARLSIFHGKARIIELISEKSL